MKARLQQISFLILAVFIICAVLPIRASASFEISGVCQVQADDGIADMVKTLDYGYAHNTYLSLRDIAMLLKNTEKSFSLEVTQNAVSLIMGEEYTPVGTEHTPWESDENLDISLRRNGFETTGYLPD